MVLAGLGLGPVLMSLSSLKYVHFVPSKPQILHLLFSLIFCLYHCFLLLFLFKINFIFIFNANVMCYDHFCLPLAWCIALKKSVLSTQNLKIMHLSFFLYFICNKTYYYLCLIFYFGFLCIFFILAFCAYVWLYDHF